MVHWLTLRGLHRDRHEVFSAGHRLTFRGLPVEGLALRTNDAASFPFLRRVPMRQFELFHRRASPGQGSGHPLQVMGSWGNHWKFSSHLGSLQRCGGHCRGSLWNAGMASEPWKCLCGSPQTHSLGSGRCHLESLRSQRRYLGSGNLPSAPAAWRLFLQSQVQLFGLWYLWRVDMDQTRQLT